jgi:hypothetical protein
MAQTMVITGNKALGACARENDAPDGCLLLCRLKKVIQIVHDLRIERIQFVRTVDGYGCYTDVVKVDQERIVGHDLQT